ncbi:MAG TPA: hypothetical protein VM537_05240 [Anaerolineae bacterium]|nr:hypothetical protein [Anaerolineae bacterium]
MPYLAWRIGAVLVVVVPLVVFLREWWLQRQRRRTVRWRVHGEEYEVERRK